MQKSLIYEKLNKRVDSKKSEITIYFFNSDKKIVFLRSELAKLQ